MLAATPTAGPLLLPALREELGVRALGAGAACLRLRGCLALAEARGGAGLREGVLALALRALLDLDVDIRWQDIAAVPGAPPAHRARAAAHWGLARACTCIVRASLYFTTGVEPAARAAGGPAC